MNCPACGGDGARRIWMHKDMDLAECPACGLIFQTEESAAAKNSALIDSVYSEYTGDRAAHLAVNRLRLDKMERLLGRGVKGLKVLELGMGNGALASLMVERGADYRGFEPYGVCRGMIEAAAPELLPRVIPAPFSPEALGGEQFDLVVANDALEHMRAPRAALEGIRRVLGPGGRLYLEVPDESWLRVKGSVRIAFGMYGRGYPTNPDHVSLFRPAAFRRLLESCGFTVETLLRESVWGDPRKMRIALGGKMPLHMLAALWALKLTRLDIVLGGNIVSVSRPG